MLIFGLLKNKQEKQTNLMFCIKLETLTLCLPLVAVIGITQWQHEEVSFFLLYLKV